MNTTITLGLCEGRLPWKRYRPPHQRAPAPQVSMSSKSLDDPSPALSIASRPVIPAVPTTLHLPPRGTPGCVLEYHPHVRIYQRGDASSGMRQSYGLVTDLGTPYRINYVFEGKPHEYLPDFVGTLCDGGLLIAEAGRESEKSKGKALVKAEAARRLALLKGGVYWLGIETHLSERRHQNWLYLHARRQSFPPIKRLPKPSCSTSPGVRCPVSTNWSSALAVAGPKPKSKRRSGNWWEMQPPRADSWWI